MLAAVNEVIGEGFVVREVELAKPIGREVLIEVRAAGLCHSDLTAVQNDYGFPLPIIHGHETAGVVIGIGPQVTEFSVGDHVVSCLLGHCGVCAECRRGRIHACLAPGAVQRPVGEPPRITRDGEAVTQGMDLAGFAERMLVHENNIVRVPDAIPFEYACILGCGVVTGAGAVVNAAQVRLGQTVAVIGCGGLGLNAIQAARLSGARRIVAIDISDEKLDLARGFGATDVVNGAVDDPVAAVQQLCGGVDVSLEFVGRPVAAQQAFGVLAPGGQALLIGVQAPGTMLELELGFPFLEAHAGVRGVKMGSSNFKLDIPMYADYFLQGRFDLESLVSQTLPLREINEGYAALDGGRVARSVIRF